ncbi:MAG TPA: GDP-L-fucose synthase [Nitrospinaceae bacterium]|nr:GDP-L-fucose synthase [Nitrospinaceae bacterium]
MNKSSKIFVAGHTGLIGSAIIRKLRLMGYARIITRTHKSLDLKDRKRTESFFSKEQPEYVILAAAKVGSIQANDTYPAEFIFENLTIQNNVIDLSWKYRVKKLLYLGSSCAYPKKCSQPMKEESLLTGSLEPTNEPYAIAKLAGIKMCQAYHRQYGAKFISVIPANVYGVNDHFNESAHVLPTLIKRFHQACLKNSRKVILWGTGKPKREFFYVDDLADACLFLLKKYNEPEVINVGVGQETSISQLAQKIRKISGYRGELVYDTSRPDGNPRRLLNSSKVSALGWKAQTSLDTGLQLTWNWFLKMAKK